MEVFINECSFHAQFNDRLLLDDAFKSFRTVLVLLASIRKDLSIFYKGDVLHVYQVYANEPMAKSLGNVRDKSLALAVYDAMYNRLGARDWTIERVHSDTDVYMCEEENVTNTSIGELAEMKLRDRTIKDLLINFPASKFSSKDSVEVSRNSSHSCTLSCADDEERLDNWLKAIGYYDWKYDFGSDRPPYDFETVLRDHKRFSRTGNIFQGRKIYKEIATGHYWYVDNLHKGKGAHLEIFNRKGQHLSEADLYGDWIQNSCDPEKSIVVS